MTPAERREYDSLHIPETQYPGLLDFVPQTTPTFDRPDHLASIADVLTRASQGEELHIAISTPPQHGKDIANDTPILTRRGWVTVGEVVLGDYLVASDGSWTKVVGVYPQGMVPLWRVGFTSGKSAKEQVFIDTGHGHLWQTHRRDDHGYKSRPKIKTTGEMIGHLLEADGKHSRYQVPVVQPLLGRDTKHSVDPYLLGLWLGDGHSRCGNFTTADASIVAAFAEHYPTHKTESAGSGLASTYLPRGLTAALRALGLIKNKHVPDSYLYGSVETRLAVLQGLCDSDGFVSKSGAQQCFGNTNPRLIDAVKWLVSSLGGTWSDSGWYTPTIAGRPQAECQQAMDVYFRLPDGLPAFRLARKAERLTDHAPRNRPRRYIHSITPIGYGHSTCFTVEAVDHLFCVGKDLVVTHNTELLLHALAWMILQWPKRHAYATYSTKRAHEASRIFKKICDRAKIQLQGNQSEWFLPSGASVSFVGMNGGLTGKPVDGMLIIDDPLKNRVEAESLTFRDRASDFIKSTATTRMHPGSSILIVQTRWHNDDPIGRVVKEGWEYINLPVLGDERNAEWPHGKPLWPKRRPFEWLMKQKDLLASDYDWQSLYFGRPRAKGGRLFEDVYNYEPGQLPKKGYRVAIGVDLAYTAKSSADWSVAVVLAEYDGWWYVLEVVREQCSAPDFMVLLQSLQKKYPGANSRWYASGTEKGAADFMKRDGLNLIVKPAVGDKFQRAQPVSGKWSKGRVLLPKESLVNRKWLVPFVRCVCGFTGLDDPNDDDVDALAAAFDQLRPRPVDPEAEVPPEHPLRNNPAYKLALARAKMRARDEDFSGVLRSHTIEVSSGKKCGSRVGRAGKAGFQEAHRTGTREARRRTRPAAARRCVPARTRTGARQGRVESIARSRARRSARGSGSVAREGCA